ncbi:p-hydroxybenzoic acid efflux pump subunit AaeA [Calidithermus terrae]|uniref:p-hydroxybenzoic acid efflux pump subunit AaeA n=1 Tax=Calidithermus terrae TaxID=1408545 RepID=A0A399EFI5_9DEIN|nr:HlyD family efflux transporter periplasmic adaptor subunit [Calidithermus terrae]RIH82313.1 p-hydroxybenzoic acid efflux pump subunit AaeA [Calidithermus terrae]
MRAAGVYLALGLSLLALAACRPQTGSATAAKEEPAAERVVRVRVVAPKTGRLVAARTTGVTLAPARESQVAAGASGRVERVLVSEGARVAAGQAVIELEATNARSSLRQAELGLEQARVNLSRAQRSTQANLAPLQAQLEAARTNLSVAERRLKEGRELAAAGAIAAVELSGLEAARAQAQAAFDNAQENLSRARRANQEDLALLRIQLEQAQVQVQQARKALGETVIRAPYAGVVAEVLVNPGEFVAAGSRAFRLADTRSLEARFRIPPSEAARLPVGSGLNLDYQGKTYYARLVRTAQVPGNDRLVEAVAQVAAPLTPGATANLRYNLELAQGVLLPSGALLPGERPAVMLAEEGQARTAAVRVLGDNGTTVAVDGVPAGARVIYPVPPSLRDGDRVEVIP